MVYNDPHIPDLIGELEGELHSVPLSEEELARSDCAVVVTSHSVYDWNWIAEHAGLIVDTRNALAVRKGKARVIGL